MEVSDLLDRKLKNSCKDAHWGQEDNAWTKQEFQQWDKNIEKYKIETIELKNIMIELKNPIKWFKNWLSDQMEERFNKFKVEFIQLEKKKKRMKTGR